MHARTVSLGMSGREAHASPPACATLRAPLKAVVTTRRKAERTGEPSLNLSAAGTTVHPRRTPVKPAYLEKEPVSMATWKEGGEGGERGRRGRVEKGEGQAEARSIAY